MTLDYLTVHRRCLAPESFREARLGFADPVRATSKDGRPYEARGIVVPWLSGGVPTLVKVRQPEERRRMYAEVYRDRARHSSIYPGPEAIRAGLPLVMVEGEFDAVLLG